MKLNLFLACLLIPTLTRAEFPPLPPAFATAKGQTITGGRVLAITDKGIKIMHDGGLALLPPAELPAPVQQLLGLPVTAPMPVVTLPHPWQPATTAYQHPVLIGVDPDGIRIRHDIGHAKVRYEDIAPSLRDQFGEFDPDKAEAFRQLEQQQQQTAIRQINAANQAVNQAANQTAMPAADDAELQRLKSDPKYVSPNAYVRLTARSQGGKSRYEPWKTDYGSYQRTDTSSRQYFCAVNSTSRSPQRVRVQCFVLTRSQDDRSLNVTEVQDTLVDLPGNGAKSVGAQSVVQNTDDKYVALGLREQSGDKYLGWTWRALDGSNRIISVISSTSGYDHYAQEQPVR